jgi:hypothetical protein
LPDTKGGWQEMAEESKSLKELDQGADLAWNAAF